VVDREALEGIEELPHVAGPVPRRQPREGIAGETRWLQAEPPPDARETGPDEPGHVLGARAQRGKGDVDHGQPEVEVGPEATLAHLAAQVPARRRDHPRRHGERLTAADPLELAILEYAQQRRL
jgi:hypothetical protein